MCLCLLPPATVHILKSVPLTEIASMTHDTVSGCKKC